ncbi:cell division initiation protein [Anaerobacterium chartisolvens]|uniref:Cell division initiation protein n=1 Tax=Anaerobacterium chartisolvens TaxID=1297424 RepID=A0A369B8T7_9FIRM|nr:hypothetical protein [Anaerobacterium chartisolvens]RCX17949.1 cell division initiation protein [Anaerobacterium chartisolvens]
MAGEKRFRTSILGFKRTDVNTYIEKILKEFDDKLQEKDEQISAFVNQIKDMKLRYGELAQKADQVNDDRAKIGDVLIKAQEKADLIIEDAKNKAMEEKRRIEVVIEQEREKLVDLKSEIRFLKSELTSTLKKYENQLNNMLEKQGDHIA